MSEKDHNEFADRISDELDRYFNRGSYFINEIRHAYPLVWNVIGEAITRSNQVMRRVNEHYAVTPSEETRRLLGLWGSVRRYQINSILEIFSRNLDEGLAILRMATELVRTIKAISSERGLYRSWVGGKDLHAKFDLNDSVEKTIFDTYKSCTNYGTHGHKTSAVFLEDTFPGKEPSLAGVATVASYWFTSFAPIHQLSLKCVAVDAPDVLLECDLTLMVIAAKLLERVQNDPFFIMSRKSDD